MARVEQEQRDNYSMYQAKTEPRRESHRQTGPGTNASSSSSGKRRLGEGTRDTLRFFLNEIIRLDAVVHDWEEAYGRAGEHLLVDELGVLRARLFDVITKVSELMGAEETSLVLASDPVSNMMKRDMGVKEVALWIDKLRIIASSRSYNSEDIAEYMPVEERISSVVSVFTRIEGLAREAEARLVSTRGGGSNTGSRPATVGKSGVTEEVKLVLAETLYIFVQLRARSVLEVDGETSEWKGADRKLVERLAERLRAWQETARRYVSPELLNKIEKRVVDWEDHAEATLPYLIYHLSYLKEKWDGIKSKREGVFPPRAHREDIATINAVLPEIEHWKKSIEAIIGGREKRIERRVKKIMEGPVL